ncbi:MAG: FHA domain-containing protein, partial [Planctomycetota bacterium]
MRIEFRGAETVVSLKEGETTVGRSNRCTIHLPDPGLAPVHFRIRERDRGYQLKDDGSGIGTLVNGKPVYATTLQHGDAIEAGGLRCVFLAEAEAPARTAPPPPPAPPPAAPRDIKVFLWAGIAAVVVLAGVFFLLSRSSEKEAQAAWQEARRALDDSRIQLDQAVPRLRRAVEILERIDQDYPGTRIAGIASAALLDAKDTLDALRRLDAETIASGGTVDEEAALDAFARLAQIKQGAHPAVVARADRLIEELKQARIAQHEARFAAAKRESDGFLAEKQFASALRLWSEFEVAGYSGRKRADRELEAVARKIAIEYRAVLKLAGRSPELDGRIGLLEASRDTFRGTKHGEDLEVRIGALRARRSQGKLVVVDRETPPKKPATGKQPGTKEEPTDVEPAAYEDPPRVVDLSKRRRYAEAASMLHSISRHPHAKTRIEELTLLANLMADLVGAVQTRADEFTAISLRKGAGRGDARGATAAVLKVLQNGAETDVPWEALPAKSFVKLFRQAGFHKPPRLAVALFFDEEGLENHATQAYVNFFESEQTPVTLTRILARRRGIKEPAGGFVLFRKRLVAPAEKARVLLLERIEALAKQARTTTNEKRRREAWAELEQIGEPALETLRLVLRDRRSRVADELRKSKAFSPSCFAARFGRDLQKRRKEALNFILDPNKYPYPNKSDAAQKAAEKLVEEVRK